MSMSNKFSLVYDRLRWEEKEIIKSFESISCNVNVVDAKGLFIELSKKQSQEGSLLIRCVSHYRSWLIAEILESYGSFVLNRPKTISICMNKILTTLKLASEGIPIPKTVVSFSPESAFNAKDTIGFPLVIKPAVGSRGKMVSLARDCSSFKSIIELREMLSNPLDHVYYIQEYVNRPPRDIRAIVVGQEIVACVYRYSPPGDWRTNVAIGGKTEPVKLSPELEETILKTADIVGLGVLGIDLMESNNGYVVHEVNSSVEFRGAQSVTDAKISDKIVNYFVKEAKK